MKKAALIVSFALLVIIVWKIWDNQRRTANFDYIPGWNPDITKVKRSPAPQLSKVSSLTTETFIPAIVHGPREPSSVERSANTVARLFKRTCLEAAEGEETADQFRNRVVSQGMMADSIASTGRMTNWAIPGGTVSYAKSKRLEYRIDILCVMTLFDPGAPAASDMIQSLKRFIPLQYSLVRTTKASEFTEYEVPLTFHTESTLKLGSYPRMCGNEGVGCNRAQLVMVLTHLVRR